MLYSASFKWLSRIDFKGKVRDSVEAINEINGVIIEIRKKSHLAAAVDSIIKSGNKLSAYIYVGDRLQWARLHKGNMEEEVLSKTGYRDKVYNQYRFRYRQFGRFTENILSYYENHGFPFVSLQLDSIRFVEGQGIEARLHLEKHKYVVIDTVEVHGGDLVAHNYLYNYLNVRPGLAYNESNVVAISPRIADLTFLSEERPPQVLFTDTKTTLRIFLRKRRASRFDGIIGLLQDEETGEVQFTGDVKLGLMNIFKRGELIGLNWRGLPNNTQDLNLKFNLPYLLNTPFGIDLEFKLYKRDTTFLDVISTFGLQYFMNSRDYLKIIYQNHRSNLISTTQYEGKSQLPPVLDFSTNLYGAEIFLNRLDYNLNPNRGFKVVINGKTGFKNIRRNPSIEDSLYEAISLRNIVYRGEFHGNVFFSLASRHVLMFGNQTAYLQNEQILRNELYRIGGLKTLRGFNEETIFVSAYSIGTVEYRFILDKNSNLNLFGDFAYVETDVYDSPKTSDYPFGFGVGTTFETAAGLFSISYAIGSQQGNPVDFRGAKIHFGFLNYF
jgi:hypothetical protein